MKKLFLAGAVALFGTVSAQQADGFSGRTFLMGNVGFGNSVDNNTDVKQSVFEVAPTVGYFVNPTVAIGAGLGYESSTNKVDADNKVVVSSIKVEPLVRKYWSLSERFFLFGQLSVPMSWGKTETTATGTTTTGGKYASYGVAVAPGIDYFLNKNWSLEAAIGLFSYENKKPEGAKSNDTFNFGLNTQKITFGVKYVFN